MKLFKKGITVKKLIEELQKLPQEKPFYVSSDEEGNTIFKGIYLDYCDDYVLVAGLSGLEVDDGVIE